jgi:hypothetical protein
MELTSWMDPLGNNSGTVQIRPDQQAPEICLASQNVLEIMELVGVEEISSVSIQAPIHPFVLWPFCNWILNLLDLTVNEHHRHSVAHHHKTRVCFSNLDILTNIWMLVTEILHCHCRALNPNPKVRGSRGKEMFSRREAVHP